MQLIFWPFIEDFELINGQREGKILVYQNYLYNSNGKKITKAIGGVGTGSVKENVKLILIM